jgi:transcriptional regulator with XRE-family HTH domain
MDRKAEIREFLASRRAKITPADAGLQIYGGNRRVTGLRREEVAMLAGVSAEYYTRLERGNLGGASDTVLDAVATALHLDDAERTHLFDLARTASASPTVRRRPSVHTLRPAVQRILDTMAAVPAYVRNDRMDILGGNRFGLALCSPIVDSTCGPPNTARFMFLDPASSDYYLDWEESARNSVAILRSAAGRNPYDKALQDLVGELSTRSQDFRERWAAHDVRFHRSGFKRIRHPLVGELDLTFEAFDLAADEGLTMIVYDAEPASRTSEALALLASWTGRSPAAVDQPT